jgi:serine/threonine-protein kinase
LREARAAAALKHPGIAVVHEIDDDLGVTFIAMELLEGRKLSDLVKGKELAPAEALVLVIQVAEALGPRS